MSTASKTWTVGEVVTAANMNTYLRDNISDLQANKINLAQGSYTGDGSTGLAITGLGFQPDMLWVWQEAAGGASAWSIFTTSSYIAGTTGNPVGNVIATAEVLSRQNRIVSLDTGGFTVSDTASDSAPNQNGKEYYYFAWGVEA